MLTQAAFQKQTLDDSVRDASVELRQVLNFLEFYILICALFRVNSGDFFRIAEDTAIPVLIFSAGLGDLIDILLKQQTGKVPSNVHTISNFMEFDSKVCLLNFLVH